MWNIVRSGSKVMGDLLFIPSITIVLPLLLLNHVGSVMLTWPLPPV